MLYRALVSLDGKRGKIDKGDVFTDADISASAIAILLDRQRIAEVSPPPLEILPDWGGRAAELASIGITTAEQVITADVDELAETLNKDHAIIRAWQSEILSMLIIPDRKCWKE